MITTITTKKNKITPTMKQRRAIKNVVENGGNVSKAMRDAKYSIETAKNPKKLTDSRAWEELVEENLPDKDLSRLHKKLLNSKRIEHMVFPTATEDKDITSLLKSVNCVVRKIQHGDMAIHVWFWATNDKALQSGLEMAYKLKGRYAPDKVATIEFNKYEWSNYSDK